MPLSRSALLLIQILEFVCLNVAIETGVAQRGKKYADAVTMRNADAMIVSGPRTRMRLEESNTKSFLVEREWSPPTRYENW